MKLVRAVFPWAANRQGCICDVNKATLHFLNMGQIDDIGRVGSYKQFTV